MTGTRHLCWKRYVLAGLALCLVPVGRGWGGQDDAERQAQIAVRRLAAFRALITLVEHPEEFYALPEPKLAPTIEADLAAHREYGDALCSQTVQQAFREALAERVEQVATAMDPQGSLELLPWLRAKMDERPDAGGPTLSERAAARVNEDLARREGKLQAAYRRARTQVARKQTDRARQALAKTPGLRPTPEQIVQAFHEAKAHGELVQQFLEKLAATTTRPLLAEAETELRNLATGLVDNGVAQYHQQLQVLARAQIAAYTPEGIEQEALHVLAQRVGDREPVYLRSDAEQRNQEVRTRFEGKLDAVVRRTTPAVSADLQATIAKAIADRPSQHRQPKDSLEAFREAVVKDAQGRVVREYEAEAKQVASSFDTTERFATLPAHVTQAMDTPTAKCRPAWNTLAQQSEQALDTTLKDLRGKVAAGQAKERCETLMDGTWRPQQADIQKHPLGAFGREHLRDLPVWKGQPATEAELIEETWSLLVTTAKERLQTANAALTGQQACVDRLRMDIIGKIKQAPERGSLHWRTFYTQEVQKLWEKRADREPAAAAYKTLFGAVEEQIRGVVDRAIQSEVLEAQQQIVPARKKDIQQAVDEDHKKFRYAVFDPHYRRFKELVAADWAKHELAKEQRELRDLVELEMGGIVQRMVDAQHNLHKEELQQILDRAKPEIKTPEDLRGFPGRIEKAAGRPIPAEDRATVQATIQALRIDVAESLQNRVVDEVRPEVAAGLRREMQEGKEPERDAVQDRFVQRVAEDWGKVWEAHQAELGPAAQPVRPSVKERIAGIVGELLNETRMKLRAEVLSRQAKLVEKHKPFMQEAIQKDQAAGEPVATNRPAYQSRYEQQVQQDWEKDEWARIPAYAALLQETRDQIAGIISNLIDSHPERPAPSEPAKVASETSGAGRSEGTGYPSPGPIPGPGTVGDGGAGGKSPGGIGGGKGGGAEKGEGVVQEPERRRPLPWWMYPMLVSLLFLILALVYWWWKERGRAGEGGPAPAEDDDLYWRTIVGLFEQHYGTARRCCAAAQQMFTAVDKAVAYKPPSPVTSLAEWGTHAQGLTEPLRSWWATQPGRQDLPSLLPETEFLLWGAVSRRGRPAAPASPARPGG